jgi:hypothetical protein
LSGFASLKRAEQLIELHLGSLVKSLFFEPKLARVRINLSDSNSFFVRYNDHAEYRYSLIFSSKDLDRVRFDNHDDLWKVKSRPHHFHPRLNGVAFSSLMIGYPDHDIPLLSELIKNRDLWREDLRFL